MDTVKKYLNYFTHFIDFIFLILIYKQKIIIDHIFFDKDQI